MSECEHCIAPLIQMDINHLMSDMLGERHGISRIP